MGTSTFVGTFFGNLQKLQFLFDTAGIVTIEPKSLDPNTEVMRF
jgi:hypothetical protein